MISNPAALAPVSTDTAAVAVLAQARLDTLAERLRAAGRLPRLSFETVEDFQAIALDTENGAQLQALGVQLRGQPGPDNRLLVPRGTEKLDLTVTLPRSSRNNLVVLGEKARLRAHLIFEGSDNLVSVGGQADNERRCGEVVFRGHENYWLVGRQGSFGHLSLWIEGRGCGIAIGDDPLISSAVWIRTADGHGAFDLETRQVVNEPQAVVVGAHVWLGQNVTVLKGAAIGEGSIIGAGSLVTQAIPPASAAAGVPCKVIRRGRSWTRAANPTAEQIQAVVDQLSPSTATPLHP